MLPKPDTKFQNTSPKQYVVPSQYDGLPDMTFCKAFVMFREFILGNNQTGLLDNSRNVAVGGEDPSILIGPNNILPGETSILFGSGTRTSFYAAPSATIASWNSFFATVAAADSTSTGSSSATGAGDTTTSAGIEVVAESLWVAVASLAVSAILVAGW